MTSGPAKPERLTTSLRSFVANLVGLAQTRLELLSVETREEILRLGELLLYGALALIMLALGVTFLAVLLTVLLWDGYRLLALAIFSTLFLTLGGVAAVIARARWTQGGRLWGSSLNELASDKERLES